MVTFQLDSIMHKVIAFLFPTVPVEKLTDVKWFDEDITVTTGAKPLKGAVVVVDFHFSVPTIVEFTRGADKGGNTRWTPLNDVAATGGSHFIRFAEKAVINLRAKVDGNLIYVSVAQV